MTPQPSPVQQDPSTLGHVIDKTRQALRSIGIESAEPEARWLVEAAVGVSPLQQTLGRSRLLSRDEAARVEAWVDRRLKREPLQYILGTQEFCGLEFHVNSSVLIPRPETELLISETIRHSPRNECPIFVDVGTGSGCVAVTLGRTIPGSKVFAIDISTTVLEIARQNAHRHGVETAIAWLNGDLLAPLVGRGLEGLVTAIVSNPPYIREDEWATLQDEVRLYEPRTALVAGPRGTEVHERLLREAVPFLAPGGLLVMEMGQGQSVELTKLVESIATYRAVNVVRDQAGIDRVLIAERAD